MRNMRNMIKYCSQEPEGTCKNIVLKVSWTLERMYRRIYDSLKISNGFWSG